MAGMPGLRWLVNLPGLGWTQKIPGAPLGRKAADPAPLAETTVPLAPPKPPDAAAARSQASLDAQTAADRARKRARAGDTLLFPGASNNASPTARLQTQSLIGS